MTESFFEASKEQSEVKTAIVRKYFTAWAKVIKRSARDGRIAYLDLFAGPGRYDDGTKSTPIIVLEEAIADAELRKMLVTIFNDKDAENTRSLEKAIKEIPGIGSLKYEPVINHEEVGTKMVKDFEGMNLVPTLFFVDPWGYKGLSLKLVNSVLKDWGCECIFFFNYNRINAGLGNPIVKSHMDALLGVERADALRPKLRKLTPVQRELAVVEAISEALQEMGGKYVLPFAFKHVTKGRTSHHLIFVSKHPLGYKIMKEVMANESSGEVDGVPTFEYNPSWRNEGLLFEFARPLSELKEMLLDEYAGVTRTMEQIHNEHNYGRRFIARNYKDALRELEAANEILCEPPASQRPKRKGVVTFANHVRVTFSTKKKR